MRDPSLRLKSGSAQDDAILVGGTCVRSGFQTFLRRLSSE